jgi:hypothetical protein
MSIPALIFFATYLIIGGLSVILFFGTYYYIVFRNKKIEAYFYFWEYASRREIFLLKIGASGFGVAIFLFVLLIVLTKLGAIL